LNYLAHLFFGDLVSNDPKAMLGNLMGDFIKGPVDNRFEPVIAEAIRLHRRIDVYTDAHPCVVSSRQLFPPPRRRFAGIILDVCYDHFLIRHWQQFHGQELDTFIEKSYRILESHYDILPRRLQTISSRMIGNNLLGSYRTLAGVERALQRIASRNHRLAPLMESLSDIEVHYLSLERGFLEFFPELITYVREGRGC